MHDLRFEARTTTEKELSYILARDIFSTCLEGNVAVICDWPEALLNSVKTEWSRLIQDDSTYRRNITFSSDSLFDGLQAAVTFCSLIESRQYPPICNTLYLACSVSRQDVYMVSSWMPRHSTVIALRVPD